MSSLRVIPMIFLIAIGTFISGANAVVGGTIVAPGEFKSAVRLDLAGVGGIYPCGGAIIGPRHIITAAHCLHEKKRAVVFSGVQNRFDENVIVSRAANIIPHPDYRPGAEDHDIGILVLEKDLILGGCQEAIELPTKAPSDNARAMFAGWGRTTEENPQHPETLQKAPVSLWAGPWCSGQRTKPIWLCATDEKSAICSGDSGSALVLDNTVIGIASSGPCVGGGTDRYASVYYHLDWIHSIMNKFN